MKIADGTERTGIRARWVLVLGVVAFVLLTLSAAVPGTEAAPRVRFKGQPTFGFSNDVSGTIVGLRNGVAAEVVVTRSGTAPVMCVDQDSNYVNSGQQQVILSGTDSIAAQSVRRTGTYFSVQLGWPELDPATACPSVPGTTWVQAYVAYGTLPWTIEVYQGGTRVLSQTFAAT